MEKNRFAIITVISTSLWLIVVRIFLTNFNPTGENNIKGYLGSLFLFGLLWLVLAKFVKWNTDKKIPIWVGLLIEIIILCGSADILEETNGFYGYEGWVKIPCWVSMTAIVIFVAVVLGKIIYYSGNSCKYIDFLIYSVAILLYGMAKYNPNLLVANTYDADAYLTPIFYVAKGIPFTIQTTGIYGHYALFYEIPMKLLGHDIISISRMTAFFAALVMFMFCYCLHNMIEKRVVRLLCIGTVLLEALYVLPESYYALSHNRFMAPVTIMAYTVYCIKNNCVLKRKNIVFGIIISAMGMVWNFESGIVAALSYTVFLTLNALKDIHHWKELFKIAKYFLMILVEVLIAVGFVNLYNVSCGGPLIFRSFFYPLNHHVSDYTSVWLWGNYTYIYTITLALVVFCASIWNTRLYSKRIISGEMDSFSGMLACLVIGLDVFWINRFVICDAWICIYPLSLLLGCLVDKSINMEMVEQIKSKRLSIYDTLKYAIAIWCCVVLSAFSLGNVFSASKQVEIYNSGLYDLQLLKSYAEEVACKVDKDTYAAGLGTMELYSLLGWDTGYEINDYPNLAARPEEYVSFYNNLLSKDKLFLEASVIDINALAQSTYLKERNLDTIAVGVSNTIIEEYTLAQQFQFGNRVYYYFQR